MDEKTSQPDIYSRLELQAKDACNKLKQLLEIASDLMKLHKINNTMPQNLEQSFESMSITLNVLDELDAFGIPLPQEYARLRMEYGRLHTEYALYIAKNKA